jgi:hypothetical protein
MTNAQVKEGQPLLLDPATRNVIEPKAQPGYYPGYSTLSQNEYWDEATRRVVLERVKEIPPIRFFNPEEARLLTAVCDRIIPQEDRAENHRIPIMPFIDKRLFQGRIDGYRFEGMPPDREAHRLGLQAIDEIARHLHGKTFLDLSPGEQERVLTTIHEGRPPAAHELAKDAGASLLDVARAGLP